MSYYQRELRRFLKKHVVSSDDYLGKQVNLLLSFTRVKVIHVDGGQIVEISAYTGIPLLMPTNYEVVEEVMARFMSDGVRYKLFELFPKLAFSLPELDGKRVVMVGE